jgi:isocitrate dehydrogenase
MMAKHAVTLIPGDGIGPEVTDATCKIIDAAGVSIHWEICDAGAAVFKKGLGTGVPKETVDSIVRNKVALKGPLETPVGFGEKSANVTLRKMFETYGNIRPVREIPGVITPYTGRGIDLVIVRENLEDLYAGIEHMQTPGVAQCLKVISRKGCEKIARLAFEFARSEGRKTVHCATKANIMKLSEGMLKRTFEEISPEYPDIEAHHIIIDNCAHQLVKKPEQFDVIVTTNMNGDIISDLSSALIGGLGFAPGANIGDDYAIFEAVHGSAPKYAGQNTINPTAVLLSGLMMLRHLGEFEAADTIEHALYVTLSSGILTRDVAAESGSSVSTTQFTNAIIQNLGEKHPNYVVRNYKSICLPKVNKAPDLVKVKERQVVGVDVFIETTKTPEELGKSMEVLCTTTPFELRFVACRGVKCYPGAQTQGGDFVDQARCRFFLRVKEGSATDASILDLLGKIGTQHLWGHVEKLHTFDGSPAFTKPHGEG